MRALAVLWEQRQLFITGLANTVTLVAVAAVIALVLGAALSIVLMTGRPFVRRAGRALVDLMRCIPFLLLAYMIYFGLPSLGLRLDAWWSGLLSLAVYNIAYIAEIFRAAWANLPREQTETGHAFGFVGLPLYRRIVFPQIVLAASPVIGNQLIVMIKDSAFLMIITVPEITFAAGFINANYFIPFAPFMVAVLLYWGLCLLVELAVKRIDRAADARRHA